MGFDVLVVCYEFFGIGFCCYVGFGMVKSGRFEVRERERHVKREE